MARISKKAAVAVAPAPIVVAPVAAPKARKAAVKKTAAAVVTTKAAPKAKTKTKVVASVKRAGSARRKTTKK